MLFVYNIICITDSNSQLNPVMPIIADYHGPHVASHHLTVALNRPGRPRLASSARVRRQQQYLFSHVITRVRRCFSCHYWRPDHHLHVYGVLTRSVLCVVCIYSEVQLDRIVVAPQKPQGPLWRALDPASCAHERASV